MLDVRTIVALLIVVTLLMVAILAIGIRGGRRQGTGKWISGLALVAVAWSLIAGRGTLPGLAAIALADAVLLAALCLQLAALLEFSGKPVPRGIAWAPGALLFLVLVPIVGNFRVVTAVSGIPIAAVLFAIAWIAARLGASGAGPVRWVLTGVFATGGIALVGRGVAVWIDPATHTEFFAHSAVLSAAFVFAFTTTIGATFAFLELQRERAEAEIRRLALRDGLTNLFNRRAFLDLAGRERSRAKRTRQPFSVLMLDIDLFKRVNDTHGHAAGDRVLTDFAAAVKRCLRNEDLVGRYGGEEFCVLLPATALAPALVAAERIRAAVACAPLGGLAEVTTVSIGASDCAAGAADTLEEVIARADAALYRAKKEGRNRVAAPEGSALEDVGPGRVGELREALVR